MIDRLFSMGHESPFEHASFTFGVSGVSRSLLAQITRHRIASHSVQSQRYVRMNGGEYVTPQPIANNQYALRIFEDHLEACDRAYRDIVHYLMSEQLCAKYADMLPKDNAHQTCGRDPKFGYLMLDSYFDSLKTKDEPSVEDDLLYAEYRKDRKAAEKYAIENARAVLPNASATQFVVTMNARELMHFFSLRCCNRAQDEIRSLADEMLRLCKEVAPHMFAKAGASCVRGECSEGPMCCGHPRTGGDEQ